MSFIATAKPPLAEDEIPVSNDPWFPAIDPEDARAVCRLDGTVTAKRLSEALKDALDSVNGELDAWRTAREAEGHTSLADVPARQLGGASVQLARYQRAVYACLQALLAEAYREIDTTPQGAGKQERVQAAYEVKVDEHRRNMRWAISDILGIGRSTVDLI